MSSIQKGGKGKGLGKMGKNLMSKGSNMSGVLSSMKGQFGDISSQIGNLEGNFEGITSKLDELSGVSEDISAMKEALKTSVSENTEGISATQDMIGEMKLLLESSSEELRNFKKETLETLNEIKDNQTGQQETLEALAEIKKVLDLMRAQLNSASTKNNEVEPEEEDADAGD